MKKTLPILTVSLLLTASWAMGQTASLAFNDNTAPAGTLVDSNPATNAATFSSGSGTFNVDVNLTFSGGTGTGLSYWLETESGTATHLSITSETYATFATPQDNDAKPWAFTDTSGTNAGFLSDQSSTQTGDLGAIGTSQAAGTYNVSTLGFTLSSMPAGTYHLFTTNTGLKPSEATVALNDTFISQVGYTFTVVPEPSTWSLMGLGGLGSFGLTWLRARKRS
jgi:hypothetical protein